MRGSLSTTDTVAWPGGRPIERNENEVLASVFSDLFRRKETQTMEAHAGVLPQVGVDMRVEPADEFLVAQARGGNIGAFETLFMRHRTAVFRFVYQLILDRDDADDLTQECFVRAYGSLDRFREECRFTTWLMRIAANLCTDRARMRTRRHHLLQQQAADGLAWMTEEHTSDPVTNLEKDHRSRALHRALAALPVHHRTVLLLRDFEEKDYKEISAILGCTIGGAKLRVLRARRALRDRVAPLLGEETVR